eukprot:CAMPEP_0115517950 /NCGR_PEP_ID=MMETSP0271-20121206/77601_1 /TAXON_ID=71861 /ORGANISM="Scrippsiella trochoidea, Strain CCMP3099" /LENGTH=72 /DNA_ID=CAMNT_0002948779 /DNA_START=70 /DNA_END=284 /DNA_ORIENTATION=-
MATKRQKNRKLPHASANWPKMPPASLLLQPSPPPATASAVAARSARRGRCTGVAPKQRLRSPAPSTVLDPEP